MISIRDQLPLRVDGESELKMILCEFAEKFFLLCRGFTEVGGQTADLLQKVELSIIDVPHCKQLYNDQEYYDIDETQICAGELDGGKDTCQVCGNYSFFYL